MTYLEASLAGFAVAWLWMGVIAPTIARMFGVPLAFGFWRLDRKNWNLTKLQFIWAWGVFGFGTGMFLSLMVLDLLLRKMVRSESSFFSHPLLERIGIYFFLTLLIGGLTAVGWRNQKRLESLQARLDR